MYCVGQNGLTQNVKIHQKQGKKWTTTLNFRLWFKLLHRGRIVRVEIYVHPHLSLSANNFVFISYLIFGLHEQTFQTN